jgi:PPOX class probable F420-dependent enzyme
MTPNQRDDFLREARIAKLVTLRDDGSPTVNPVWFEWDGTSARLFTSRGTGKVKRIAANPRVALSVETGVGEPEAWVSLEGDGVVLEEGGKELARRLIERYYDDAKIAATWPSWEAGAANFVVIELTPSRIVSSV